MSVVRSTAVASRGVPGDWAEDAACQGKGGRESSVFFPVAEGQEYAAKKICAGCPVAEPCLEFALATKQENGVWGGRGESERRAILRRRRMAVAS